MRIILIGFGSVGIPFARNLQQSEGELLHRFGLRPRVVAVVDRGGAAVDPQAPPRGHARSAAVTTAPAVIRGWGPPFGRAAAVRGSSSPTATCSPDA